jgi:hypothetical protein
MISLKCLLTKINRADSMSSMARIASAFNREGMLKTLLRITSMLPSQRKVNKQQNVMPAILQGLVGQI